MTLYDKISQKVAMKFPQDESTESTKPSAEYKILIFGDSQVGKTSLCHRFALNEFNLEIKPTAQAECFTKTIKLFDQFIQLFLIDTNEKSYKAQKEALYADVKGVIMMYSITQQSSIDYLDNYRKDLKQFLSQDTPILLLGNKTDLFTLKSVSTEQLIDKAKEFNSNCSCEISEVNCIEPNLANDAITLLIARIYYVNLPESEQQHLDNLHNPKK